MNLRRFHQQENIRQGDRISRAIVTYYHGRDVDDLCAQVAAIVQELPHDQSCASLLPGYIAGGISTDVNVRPNAHEVKATCNCRIGEALALLRGRDG